jgi:putative hydrolase of the HAD superfamily
MRPRALLFDLDETLYPEPRFMLSGFAAVATEVARVSGTPASTALWHLARTARGGGRVWAFQSLCERFELDLALVPAFLETYRRHQPRLRLSREARAVLADVRPTWRTAIITNGAPDVQARKVEALGVGVLVDEVVLAHATGGGAGKPDAEPFLEALERLGVEPARAVMVGDDPWADIHGATRLGIRTIRLRRGRLATLPAHGEPGADAEATRLRDVPAAAARLLQERPVHAD